MNTNLFVVYILTLAMGLTFFYAEARKFFSPIKEYQAKVERLEGRVTEERVKHLRTSFAFKDFRTQVAVILPSALEGTRKSYEKSYPIRTLASVVQHSSNEKLNFARATTMFEQGKELFREKSFDEANVVFKKLIELHPYSVHIPEALFLIVEGHFVLQEFDECLFYMNKMLDLFPENDLTGYAMVRMGQVYVREEKLEEAIEIYKTVLNAFSDPGLSRSAYNSLRAISL